MQVFAASLTCVCWTEFKTAWCFRCLNFPDLETCTMNLSNTFDYYRSLRNKFGAWNCECSSIAPSSLALPPEMAFQRTTGGMPVHITVHRGLPKQLVHLHAAAVHTRSFRSCLRYCLTLSTVCQYAELGCCSKLNHPIMSKTRKIFLGSTSEVFHISCSCILF